MAGVVSGCLQSLRGGDANVTEPQASYQSPMASLELKSGQSVPKSLLIPTCLALATPVWIQGAVRDTLVAAH